MRHELLDYISKNIETILSKKNDINIIEQINSNIINCESEIKSLSDKNIKYKSSFRKGFNNVENENIDLRSIVDCMSYYNKNKKSIENFNTVLVALNEIKKVASEKQNDEATAIATLKKLIS